MNLIEQAARRLEELQRAGVNVPWNAAGLSQADGQQLLDSALQSPLRETSEKAVRSAVLPPSLAGVAQSEKPLGAVKPAAVSEPTVIELTPQSAAASSANGSSFDQRVSSKRVDLDLAHLAAGGYLVPNQPRTMLADEMRGIKRPLLRNVNGKSASPVLRANLIMVTSALPGEGKTFCATNLALSMAAEVDTSVLLIDADVVRPAVFDRLGVQSGKGLLDLLAQPELELSQVMLKTNIPKLSVMPAGMPRGDSTELLASGAMERLLDELATRYADRVVIFDAPPLLVTTESRVLAARMGQIVVVVDATHTSKADLSAAFSAVESCPVVMSVLNKHHRPVVRARYENYEGYPSAYNSTYNSTYSRF